MTEETSYNRRKTKKMHTHRKYFTLQFYKNTGNKKAMINTQVKYFGYRF